MKKILTNKQKEIYIIIKQFIEQKGYSPSIRELCNLSNRKSPATIQEYLITLKEKGYITYELGKNRTIRIKED